MKQYQVTILMQARTVTELERSGYDFQAFRAIRSSDKAGLPLLWRREEYSQRTVVQWNDGYQAYASRDPIEPDRQIRTGVPVPVEPGNILWLRAGGTREVTTNGAPGAITVHNETATYYTCGLGGGTIDSPEPFCAFPLHGGYRQVLTLTEKVLLRFSTQPLRPGTVIGESSRSARTAFSPCLLIDLASESQREVGYDLDSAWSWGGFTWAKQLPAGTDLVPWLIERPDKGPGPANPRPVR